jgi:hypothetical protein
MRQLDGRLPSPVGVRQDVRDSGFGRRVKLGEFGHRYPTPETHFDTRQVAIQQFALKCRPGQSGRRRDVGDREVAGRGFLTRPYPVLVPWRPVSCHRGGIDQPTRATAPEQRSQTESHRVRQPSAEGLLPAALAGQVPGG